MKNKLLFILIVIVSTHCYSQIKFEKGYFVDETNQKTNCLIKNIDWESNPTVFLYKLSDQSEIKKETIKSVKEFGIYNVSKHFKANVNIDRSSENVNKLSELREPLFKKEQLFLKVLIEGKANLYYYQDRNLKRYFYSKDSSNIEQLIFKSYKTVKDNIDKNNEFRRQIWNDLKCSGFKMSEINSLNYDKNDLVKFFVEFNECNNQEFTNYNKKQKRDLFNLNIRPRIVNSSLIINSTSNSRDVDFGNKTGFGFGAEAEFILGFNKTKWAIIIEPTYQNLNNRKTNYTPNLYGGSLTSIVNYSSIEIPVGLRHYFFLNENSRIFLNTSYTVDISFNSSITYERQDGFGLEPLEVNSSGDGNWVFGLGYKYNDRYSIELRLQTSREILNDYVSTVSDFKSFSMIFGYSLF
jgi:hypothetical protein